jgi:hypothetical protein
MYIHTAQGSISRNAFVGLQTFSHDMYVTLEYQKMVRTSTRVYRFVLVRVEGSNVNSGKVLSILI